MEGRSKHRFANGEVTVCFYKADEPVGEGVKWSADGQTAWRLRDGDEVHDGQVVEEISLEEARRIAEAVGVPEPLPARGATLSEELRARGEALRARGEELRARDDKPSESPHREGQDVQFYSNGAENWLDARVKSIENGIVTVVYSGANGNVKKMSKKEKLAQRGSGGDDDDEEEDEEEEE